MLNKRLIPSFRNFSNFKVLLTDNVHAICKETFEKRGITAVQSKTLPDVELAKILPEYDAVVVRSATKLNSNLIDSGVNLKYIGRAGSGTDNIDSKHAKTKNVKVMNTPGGNTNAAAELTIALMMSLQRNLYNATDHIKQGKFDRKAFVGLEVQGKTIGVVGYGAIGKAVAAKAIGLGMDVLVFDNFLTIEQPGVTWVKSMDEIYADCDFITFHCPLNKDTSDMLNAETIKKCKDGFKVLNCARGGIVNEHAILDALNSGKCGGLATDVFSKEPEVFSEPHLKELITHKNVVCSPHLGASTEEAQVVVAEMIANQISDALLDNIENHVVGDSLLKPKRPQFSSGPTVKYPTFDSSKISTLVGRSHRSKPALKMIKDSVELTRQILDIPNDYQVAITPASDTGAMEMTMWNLLGQRPVDVMHHESFSKTWFTDIKNELKIDYREHSAAPGEFPDVSKLNKDHDLVFAQNGTTSGVCIPNFDFIDANRTGVTINDATSGIFAQAIDWSKCDVTTFSWQKALGGEAAHGILVLSPKAIERLETYSPSWPLPKIFRIKKDGKLNPDIFSGKVINTVSMMAVEDYVQALKWVESIGGQQECIRRSNANLKLVEDFVAERDWINFLAKDKQYRSNSSVCLTLDLPQDKIKAMEAYLAQNDVAYDINSYKGMPVGLRVWCGPAIDSDDVSRLLPWIEKAYYLFK